MKPSYNQNRFIVTTVKTFNYYGISSEPLKKICIYKINIFQWQCIFWNKNENKQKIISAVKLLIAINRIQNKSFCLHNIWVWTVYIYYVYKYTHIHVYI